jgi:poly-beta-1,6-N-acetyl-D-glucosamine synthase
MAGGAMISHRRTGHWHNIVKNKPAKVISDGFERRVLISKRKNFPATMEDLMLFLFGFGLLIVFYTYVGYGVVIWVLAKLRARAQSPGGTEESLPQVTLLIAAYNEADFIKQKIQNTLSLDYPAGKLAIFFVTDGSCDGTPDIIKRYPAITVLHEPQRKGKIHAINRVMKLVTTPIVVFCDANTLLNPEAIRKIVRHYDDPKVGGVAGEKRIYKKEEDNASGAGEGFYWKYESFLKRKDSEVYSVVGAAGELFSIRTELFDAPDENMIIEDFYLSLSITAKGYRFKYEPDAYATETASVSVKEEWKRKVRICAGGFQAMAKLKHLLNPFRYGMLSFQYISHRVLRWTLAPLSLPLLLISNFWLVFEGSPFFAMTLAGQLLFYGLALAGYGLRDRNVSVKGFFIPYYFCVMNLSVYAGYFRYRSGKQSVVWDKAERAALTT